MGGRSPILSHGNKILSRVKDGMKSFVELAHYGFNIMCQRLIDALNLDLTLFISIDAFSGHPLQLTIDF